jgi:hypothetical protein
LLPIVAVIPFLLFRFSRALIFHFLPVTGRRIKIPRRPSPIPVFFPIDDYESPFTPGEQNSSLIPNLPFMIQLTALAARYKSLDALPLVILFEREFHAVRICAAAAEARVIRFGIEFHRLLIFICQSSQATLVLVAQASACRF